MKRIGYDAIPTHLSHLLGRSVLVPTAAPWEAWLARRCRSARRTAARDGAAARWSPGGADLGLDRLPSYGDAELAGLLGILPRRASASARRLVASSLILWSEAAIGFPEPAAGPAGPADEVLADSIGSARGALAIPRQLLRLLAQGARPALIATALGALLRCLSRRKTGFDGRGRLKASWIVRAFDVNHRGVKAARAELVGLGWLAAERSDQVAMNRWGPAYRIDLAWAPPGPGAGAQSPPPRAVAGAQLPPADLHQDPLSGMERDQEPAPGGPAGVEARQVDGCNKPAMAGSVAERHGGVQAGPLAAPPRLEDVRPEDLEDAGRLLDLHRQAAGRGLVGISEADRLKFAAAAEHARAVGKTNPCGLFARIVRRGWWSFATLGEEERAARWLREHGGGGAAGRSAARTGADPEGVPESLGTVGEALGRLGIGASLGGRGVIGPRSGGTVVAPVIAVRRGRDAVAGGGGCGGVAGSRGDRCGFVGSDEAEMLARLARLVGGGGAGS